ncbi:LTA synthase family protein [Alkalihalobacillus deserti]|uniref:LTA synthase family protein n=1 Tax=Alkalihalobacillus deserti TaxID=2879466 RepID=UPI001D135894|nr:LTA synthase family protein [Alkalihalobacillus deserti]
MANIKLMNNRLKFLWLAVLLLTLKTYLLYKVGFEISSENVLQEFILLINPLSSVILLLGVSLFFSGKKRNIIIIVTSFIGTLILYFNLIYYRFFTDFITLPVLFQTNNAKDLSSSVLGLLTFYDLFLLIDLIFLSILLLKNKIPTVQKVRKETMAIIALSILIFIVNLGIAQIERPQLLTRSFDRELLVKNIGTFNYHIYDAVIQSQSKTKRVFAESSDIDEIISYRSENYKQPDQDLFGLAEGKNVIVLSLESLQSFVINETIDGEEITPFLNKLIDESYYFENFYHQTAQGKTSDSEFLLANSMFGRDSGAVFFTQSGNTYNALPEILNGTGYYTSVMHANNKSFWNRDVMYDTLGFAHYFDINSYDVNESNSVGWGLKDKDFFEQSIELLKSQPEPYFTQFITLTNHFPFELGEEDRFINEFDSNSGTLNRYFPTVRYMDYAIEHFFERLKEEGMYEDSVFIIYGDHYGISQNHKKAMSQFLNKEEITDFDTVQLQRVPMFVHIPGHNEHAIKQTVSGQIDLKPTIMHLLGLETENDIQFGSDLFSPERDSYAVLRDGSFITDQYVYTKGACYSKPTGEEIDLSNCEPDMERAQQDLSYSDKLIYGDLLRFY